MSQEAENKAAKEALEQIQSMKPGIYYFVWHTYPTEYRIEDNKVFILEDKGGKKIWQETSVEANRLKLFKIL
jgi:hypothetical protein